MIPLSTMCTRPWVSAWGWAFSHVTLPCVAHRVWPMPVVGSAACVAARRCARRRRARRGVASASSATRGSRRREPTRCARLPGRRGRPSHSRGTPDAAGPRTGSPSHGRRPTYPMIPHTWLASLPWLYRILRRPTQARPTRKPRACRRSRAITRPAAEPRSMGPLTHPGVQRVNASRRVIERRRPRLTCSMSAPITVVVIDDHVLFRTGLRELLEQEEIRVVGEASTRRGRPGGHPAPGAGRGDRGSQPPAHVRS